jgi:hypothetical protein
MSLKEKWTESRRIYEVNDFKRQLFKHIASNPKQDFTHNLPAKARIAWLDSYAKDEGFDFSFEGRIVKIPVPQRKGEGLCEYWFNTVAPMTEETFEYFLRSHLAQTLPDEPFVMFFDYEDYERCGKCRDIAFSMGFVVSTKASTPMTGTGKSKWKVIVDLPIE